MATKADVLKMLQRIPDDEPLFLLRGRDTVASETVLDWCDRAGRDGSPNEKLDEAAACAKAMRNWPTKKVPD